MAGHLEERPTETNDQDWVQNPIQNLERYDQTSN